MGDSNLAMQLSTVVEDNVGIVGVICFAWGKEATVMYFLKHVTSSHFQVFALVAIGCVKYLFG